MLLKLRKGGSTRACKFQVGLGNIYCPLQVCCYNHPNDGAPFQVNTYLLSNKTSNKPNSWVEATYEKGLYDGGVVH